MKGVMVGGVAAGSAGLLAACGSSSSSEDTSSSSASTSTESASSESASTSTDTVVDSLYNEVGTYPIVKEPITLTVFAPSNGEYSYYDNKQVQYLEELTGIQLEWITTATDDDIQTKLSTLFASGDLPDIICTGVGAVNHYDKATEQYLGEQGLVLDLSEYLDTISVGYAEAFENVEGLRDYITTPSGAIYSLPNVGDTLHVQYGMKLWINTTWLDNLGLEMPTTTEEFYEVLKAFKEYDANGNGDAGDEIPLSTVTSGSGVQIDGFLMAPFQLTPETDKLYVDNAVVTYAATTDGYREGLKYLNKLYAEGLLYAESFTWTKTDQVNLNEAGDDCVIGCFLAQRPGYACDLTTYPGNSKKWEQYQSLDPLKNEDGEAIAAWDPYTCFTTGMTFISSSCEYPEAAFRLLDYLATYDGSMYSAYGEYGVNWEEADEGEYGLDGRPALYHTLESIGDNEVLDQLICRIITEEMYNGMVYNQDPYADDVAPLTGRQVVLYQGSLGHQAVSQSLQSVLPELYMSTEDTTTMSLLKTNVNDTQSEYMTQFITGAMDINDDSAWQAYLDALESVGLSEYLELLQKAYDESVYADLW